MGRKERAEAAGTELFEAIRDAEERAAGAQRAWRGIFSNTPSILDIALDHLTLGRAVLYRAILERSDLAAARAEIELALDGLRRAGAIEFVVRGLLARVDVGTGYRVYFARRQQTLILLLCGGDKSTQKKDIARAQAMVRELDQE